MFSPWRVLFLVLLFPAAARAQSDQGRDRPQVDTTPGSLDRPADPNGTRLFFGPTGRTLPQGEGYFGDYFLFFAMVGYGVTNDVTLTAGTTLVPGVGGQLVLVGPKVRVAHSPRLNASVGGMLITFTSGDGQAGVVYGAVTLGDADNALTLGAGLGESDGAWSSEPVLLLGGDYRIGAGAKLLAEAWVFPATGATPAIGGLRLFNRKLAVDLGVVTSFGGRELSWAPWVDVSVHF